MDQESLEGERVAIVTRPLDALLDSAFPLPPLASLLGRAAAGDMAGYINQQSGGVVSLTATGPCPASIPTSSLVSTSICTNQDLTMACSSAILHRKKVSVSDNA